MNLVVRMQIDKIDNLSNVFGFVISYKNNDEDTFSVF